MKKLLLIALVLVVLSIGLVTIAGAANAPVSDSLGAQAGVQAVDSGMGSSPANAAEPYSIGSLFSQHGLCDHGDSAAAY